MEAIEGKSYSDGFSVSMTKLQSQERCYSLYPVNSWRSNDMQLYIENCCVVCFFPI